MQSKAFVLFLSTLAFLAAPTLAVLDENDYLAAHDNVFNAHGLSSVDNWHHDRDLESFLEGRVKSFIHKDFRLQGSSLAEKLAYLAETDLFPLIDEPLTDKKVLQETINNVLISYKQKIFDAKIDNNTGINEVVDSLSKEVRDLVNRYIIAIILQTGKVPEEKLEMDFKEIVNSVESTTTELKKNDDEKKNSFKGYIAEEGKDLVKRLKNAISAINITLKDYIDNASTTILPNLIKKLHQNMVDKKVDLKAAVNRINALIDASINISQDKSYEVARHINSLYWKETSDKEFKSAMREVLVRTVDKVFNILIDKKSIEEVSQMFRDLVVYQYLARGKTDLFYSQTYCAYFNVFAERTGISFKTETDSEREATIKLLGATDYLFSLASCKDNKISEDNLRVIIKNISDIFLLEERHRAIIDRYPTFMKISDINVDLDFDWIQSLHELYINFRADNHFNPSAEGVLESLLDQYLDKIIQPDAKIGSTKFKTQMKNDVVILKIMIIMPRKLPEGYVVHFKNLGVDAYENFAVQFNNCHFEQLKKFVASLFPEVVNNEMQLNSSDHTSIVAFDDITLEKISERVKVDESKNLSE